MCRTWPHSYDADVQLSKQTSLKKGICSDLCAVLPAHSGLDTSRDLANDGVLFIGPRRSYELSWSFQSPSERPLN
jgi:hypothetical protein